MKLKRIWIFGGIASGKTTLAKEISKILKIDYYTTDDIAYKDNKGIKFNEKERDAKLKKIAKRNEWVIEGTHKRKWILPAFKKTDLVILLQFPRIILIKRIILRYIKRKRKNKEIKKFWKMIKFSIFDYKTDLMIWKRLAKKFKKEFIILKNNKETKEFLKKLNKAQ